MFRSEGEFYILGLVIFALEDSEILPHDLQFFLIVIIRVPDLYFTACGLILKLLFLRYYISLPVF
jgi:hypothetical protein